MSASIVFGGSGYVGTLIVAAVLAEAPRPLVLPIRATADREACMARIRSALLARGIAHDVLEQRLGLISLIELPALDRLDELAPMLRALGADELIHSAGCLDYWDTRLLHSVNVDLTRAIVALARTAGISRILYISTAYCSGYTDELIREQLHSPPAPHDEPTEYTRTKRIAEAIVADSGVPFVIIRPSIIIGDSQSGHYAGKNYGLYQWWRAIEGLLTREYNPIWYTVATHARLNLLHHDAFQEAILAIRATDLRASIIHVVSDDANCPTTRELCWMWADVYRPAEIHCYPSVDNVPLMAIPKRQRRVLELAAKNLEISTRRWRFETRALDLLRRAGLGFADATLASVARCQTRYIEQSTRIQTYLQSLRPSSAGEPRLFEIAGY